MYYIGATNMYMQVLIVIFLKASTRGIKESLDMYLPSDSTQEYRTFPYACTQINVA